MKRTRFSEEQMVKILREADATPVTVVAKKHGISDQTIYLWRKRFGKLEAVDRAGSGARGDERGGGKKMVSARVRRDQVAYVCRRGLSQRRACALLSVARSALGYQSRLRAKDAPVIGSMQKLAAQYPRYGYRRIHVFLGREGHVLSVDRAHRIWRQQRLQVPRRRPRRRVASHRPRPLPASGANQMWAYDFVFDACANGQQLKCLTVVDEYTRECLAIDVAGSIRSARVIEVLSRLVSVHGAPRYLRSDNGPEFVSRAVLRWLHAENIDTVAIDPGKPWQNGLNELRISLQAGPGFHLMPGHHFTASRAGVSPMPGHC